MDAYEATKVVFSRIQALDPDHAAKIMGLLLIQDHGDKEMIRLAFGPEALLHSVMAQARKELALLPPPPASASSSPTVPVAHSPFLLSRQNSGRGPAPSPSPLSASSPSSWAQAQPFSRSNGSVDEVGEELISPANSGGGAAANTPPFFPRGGDVLLDDFQLQEQLAFLNEGGVNPSHPLQGFDGAECRSPGPGEGGGMFPYGLGWANGGPGHRRSASVNELCLGGGGSDGFGWKPCLYYARGFCKNGSSCRFVHGDDAAALTGAAMDAATAEQQQCQDFLLRSKSQRLGPAAFPYSPTGSLPGSPSAATKCLSLLLQQQHNDNQRYRLLQAPYSKVEAFKVPTFVVWLRVCRAAAAAALMLGGGDEAHKFMGRPRLDRVDFASMMNPGSRQIYLTFPADSTFREDDVSNYFSIYGPVHDVRIPYQQKRMFGFVTFVYPETVKLILAKGNPHFICDARVLVKPYKEKGKVPDKKHQGDFSGCTTPTGLDGRDPFDLHQLGARMLQHSNSTNEMMLRRKLEEQQQAAELQQAIELHSRRLMDLQLLDLKNRAAAAVTTAMAMTIPTANAFASNQPVATTMVESPPDSGEQLKETGYLTEERKMVNGGGDKEESAGEASLNADSDQSLEHNLPDSPFASPTKSSVSAHQSFTTTDTGVVATSSCSASHVGVSAGTNAGGGINHLRPSALDIPSPRDFFSVSRRVARSHSHLLGQLPTSVICAPQQMQATYLAE
uniref:C3H1-type domain-containing protein n=1 Tax=Oryza meridionalis TaxID=40149 RepID=A0A0E0CZY2_9ORYZ